MLFVPYSNGNIKIYKYFFGHQKMTNILRYVKNMKDILCIFSETIDYKKGAIVWLLVKGKSNIRSLFLFLVSKIKILF